MSMLEHTPDRVQASIAQRGGLRATDVGYAGQKTYTPTFLEHIYDRIVVGFSNTWVWRCPSATITRLYDENVADVHLDVGPGTGYFLARCSFPTPKPAITLLDLNVHVLEVASRRIAHYAPSTYQANLLEPLDFEAAGFGSIALTHVLHCLPGTIDEKASILHRLAAVLRPGGRLFGTTVLARGVPHTPLSRAHIRGLNRKGIFSNREDDLEGLDRALAGHFSDYELTTTGSVARFIIRP
jgi:SAM-dependent methyltransferase